MPQKLLNKNYDCLIEYIPEAQLGAAINYLKLKINSVKRYYSDIVDSIPSSKPIKLVTSNLRIKLRDKRYNPTIEKLLKLLYNIGAFGNTSSSKAIDGIDGPKTQAAIQKAKLMGYSINGSNVTKQGTGFMDKLKNAWNSLTGQRKPTLEEYKELQRLKLRDLAARVNEQNPFPNFPLMDVGPWKGHDMDVRGKKGWDDNRIREEFSKYAQDAENYLKTHQNIEPLAKKRIEESLDYYKKVAKNPKYIDTHGGGFGCIYTASGSYGDNFRKLNNKKLSDAISRGEDTGFIQIKPDKYVTGDIVQFGRNDKKGYNPHHAEMVTDTFMGYPKLALNSATGYGRESKSNDWSTSSKLTRYLKDSGEELRVLRFVGTKDQNKKWEEEYYKLYG